MPIEKQDLDTKTADELFQEYLLTVYRLKPGAKKFDMLVLALKDAFFAGLAIASVSEQDFKLELLVYASSAAKQALDNLAESDSDKDWIN